MLDVDDIIITLEFLNERTLIHSYSDQRTLFPEILCIEVAQSKEGIVLPQRNYALDNLEEIGLAKLQTH